MVRNSFILYHSVSMQPPHTTYCAYIKQKSRPKQRKKGKTEKMGETVNTLSSTKKYFWNFQNFFFSADKNEWLWKPIPNRQKTDKNKARDLSIFYPKPQTEALFLSPETSAILPKPRKQEHSLAKLPIPIKSIYSLGILSGPASSHPVFQSRGCLSFPAIQKRYADTNFWSAVNTLETGSLSGKNEDLFLVFFWFFHGLTWRRSA